MRRVRKLCCVFAFLALTSLALASPYRGQVTFGGLPLPGATITATQGSATLTAISDADGGFAFDDLADGGWTIDVAMQCFQPVHTQVAISSSLPAATFEMKLLAPGEIAVNALKPAATPSASAAQSQPSAPSTAAKPAQPNAPSGAQEIPKPQEENEQGADGILVQGSVNNAATSQFATSAAFGNTRSGTRALYTGGLTVMESNSVLNARPFSLSGVVATKPAANNFTGIAALQGPIKIPHVLRRGPNFFISYQWTRNSDSVVLPGLVPTAAERAGDLAGLTNSLGQAISLYQPGTNLRYANNQIPVSPQAAALLKLYPQPNIANLASYNYQSAQLSQSHVDALQSRFDKNLGRKDNLNGKFAFQSTRSDGVNLFGFTDETGTFGINANVQWSHRLSPHIYLYTNYAFSRLRTEATPNFAYRENISGAAGITGNNQDAAYWGPPSLVFSDGTAALSDGNSSFNRNRSDAVSVSTQIYHRKHNISAGGEFRKQEYNDRFQQNPRGTFTFTGAATAGTASSAASGSALADFLAGVPDTSSIAYGNANKYFRAPVASAYVSDDWRLLPILTINAGLRWDYSAPLTELFGNLVNLDVASGFTAVAPVVASNPVGSVTGNHYPASLVRPDRRMIEPRLGVTWRPLPASSIVIKAGYGLYPDTSVYQSLILNMAQQAPLSKSLSVQNSTSCPLTLANGFASCGTGASATFGIDPNFRIGYAQNWQLSVQRDLPFALQVSATYSGIRGTHGAQQILPNSYPLGTANPCPSCTSGFIYQTSGGNSMRHAGQLQLRRRLRSGLAASLVYTYAKAMDDDAYLGGVGHVGASTTQSAGLTTPSASIAQDWRNPHGERSLSSFDQRQLVNLQAQYTSGQGLGGGTLLSGWRGRALKEWTLAGNLTVGTGMPETPIYPAAVPGTGFSSILRPALTGAPIYTSGSAAHLNAAAYTAPVGGWGTAGRNSITGPGQLTFNTQMARTFRPHGKWYLDVAIGANNLLNHPAYTSWNNLITSEQFGYPASASAMRSVQTTFHLRWQ